MQKKLIAMFVNGLGKPAGYFPTNEVFELMWRLRKRK